jgi:hypothetical protein
MFHLFDKVYIVSDTLVGVDFDRVVISQNHGFSMHDELNQIAPGKLIAYSQTLDEMLENSDFPTFIKTLRDHAQESNKKLVIYADDTSFSKFLSIWFKSIFVNISFDNAWLILSSYIKKEQYMKNWRSSSKAITRDIFSELTQEQFSTDFLSAQGYDLENISHLSFELLMANFFANGTYKEELKSSIKTIMLRAVTEIAIEIKYAFVKNFNKSNFPVIANDVNFFNNSTIYTDTALGRVSTQSNIVNILSASDSDIVKFKNIATQLMLDWDQFQAQSSVITLIDYVDVVRQGTMSDADLLSVIEFEKSSVGNARVFSSSDEEKVNIYFLDHVLSTSVESLSGYALK